eukprot:CAMPEP_0115640806 /NCGR_PEP_ID=MMETSP0272-20121206/35981_1 /TAXON_ID=71861 /ORGANISM="Scrippsiella trochoidea, Strain CCMP3099" /LENGTH=54 /DNA_ID=CAMNT_0003078067 /DNA_START=77 /DNA_END=237 /DNA_ORIENTATION=-
MSSIALSFLTRTASKQQQLLGTPSSRATPGSSRAAAAGSTPKLSPKASPDRFAG